MEVKLEKEKIRDNIRALFYIFLFTLINVYIPVLNIIVFFVWPIPIVYILVKYGMNNAFKIIIISALINGLLISPLIGLITIIGFGFIGFVIGGCLQEKLSPFKTLISSVLVVLISQSLILLISYQFLGLDYNYFISEIERLLSQSGQFSEFEEIIKLQLQLIKQIFPALLIISSTVTGIISYYITLWYLNKKEFDFKIFTPVRYWHFPRWIVSIGIVISLLFKFNSILYNLNIMLFFICLVQGFAVGLYYISKRNGSKIFRLIYFLAIFFIPLLPVVLIVLGLVDMWFNIRGLNDISSE